MACNQEGLVMQVPMVMGHLLELVSMAELDADNLSTHIEAINVLKVHLVEARGPSMRVIACAWWIDGTTVEDGLRTTLIQVISEAKQFFPQP